jgi:hypothetical protein
VGALQCDYRVFVPAGHRLLLRARTIGLACALGSIQVRNGPAAESPGFPGLHGDSELCQEHPARELVSQARENLIFTEFHEFFYF